MNELKARFQKARGYWNSDLDSLCQSNPKFLEKIVKLVEASIATNAVSEKMRWLLRIAFNISVTHMDREAVSADIRAAITQGCKPEEISEVFQLASVLGVHSVTTGVPIMTDELAKAGRPAISNAGELSARARQLRTDFERKRGYWSTLWDPVLALSPDFFEAYTEFSGYPWEHGVLRPKEREFIYIAVDAAVHHLYEPGLRVHMQNAIRYGATAEELIALLEILAVEGIKSSILGAKQLSQLI